MIKIYKLMEAGWATWGTFNMDNVEAVTVEPNYDELNRIISAGNLNDNLAALANYTSYHFYDLFYLDFSLKVVFSNDPQKKHLKFIEITDKTIPAVLTYEQEVDKLLLVSKFQFSNNPKINIIFEKFFKKQKYIFNYNDMKVSDYVKEIGNKLLIYIDKELSNNDLWLSFENEEKNKIFIGIVSYLTRCYRFFNKVILKYTSIERINAIRNKPKNKYFLRNKKLPVVADYGCLNEYLSYNQIKKSISDSPFPYWETLFNYLQELDLARCVYINRNPIPFN